MTKKHLAILILLVILTVVLCACVKNTEPEYVVTLKVDGEIKKTISVKENSLIEEPKDLQEEGKLVIGWYKDPKFNQPWDFSTDVVIENVTLYAIFESITDAKDFEFKRTDDGFYTLVKYKGQQSEVVIPDCGGVIKSIGKRAFEGNTNLISVTIPKSITKIEHDAFNGCLNLKEINFGTNSNLKTIKISAFSGCSSLVDVVLPNSVETIETRAFESCDNLGSITVSTSLKRIGESAFNNCSKLSVVFNRSKIDFDIGNDDFGGIAKNAKGVFVLSADQIGVIENGFAYAITETERILLSCIYPETEMVVPDGTTRIASNAFRGILSLATIAIPHCVIFIEDNAFLDCTNLKIYCETKSKPAGWDTNWNASNCLEVWGYLDYEKEKFLKFSTVNGTDAKVIDYTGTATTVEIPRAVKMGNKVYMVTVIGDHAFENCTDITTIIIPDSVTMIEDYAFNECTSLTAIEVDGNNLNFSSIDGNLYSKDGVTLIKYASGKSDISFTVPVSVTSIESGALAYCENLTSIGVDKNNPSYKSIDGNLYSKDGATLVQYAIGKSDRTFIVADDITTILDYAFSGCTKLSAIAIPNGVTAMGNCVFQSATNLTIYCEEEMQPEVWDTSWNPQNCPVIWDFANVNKSLQYKPIGSTEIEMSDYTGITTEVTIPHFVMFNNVIYLVTMIGNHAFEECTSLTSITIPDSVTTIGDYAFASCSKLVSVNIPNQTVSIGNHAFEDCASLTTVTIPDSVTTIGIESFARCTTLTTVTIGIGVTNIGEHTFSNCPNLTTITVSENNPQYKSIEGNLYSKDGDTLIQYAIGKLDTSFTIPEGVSTIGETAFEKCTNLTTIDLEGVTTIRRGAFKGCDNLASITGLENMTTIGAYAFEYCSSLASFIIPSGITTIEDGTFFECLCLQFVFIPDSVTSVGKNTFYNCIDLTYYCEAKSKPELWGEDWNCNNLSVVWGCIDIEDEKKWQFEVFNETEMRVMDYIGTASEVTIPKHVKCGDKIYTVTTIGDGAFYDCTSLTAINIPDTVTTIKIGSFYGCSSLTTINVDTNNPSYKSIDRNLYSKDGSTLIQYAIGKTDTAFTIPDSVTSIGVCAFANCDNLTSITIPDSVTTIGQWAFRDCDSLTSIEVDENNTHYKSIYGNLYSKDGTTLIQYAIGKTATSFTIPNSVTSIGSWAFHDCDSLTTITIPDSVTSIGEWAFWYCTNLTSITIPNSVTTIGYYAFAHCSNLTSITIPNSVTTIEFWAFEDCTSLTIYCEATSQPSGWHLSWNLDNRPVVWGGYIDIENTRGFQFKVLNDTEMSVVDYAGTASEIIIPKYVESSKNVYMVTGIGESAFYECKNLTSITIPDSVTTIGDEAFRWCDSLASITIPDSVTSIGDYAFYGCSNLTSITIPNSVTTIGEMAFYACTNLTTITIPNSVTTIGERAFQYCTRLTSIEVDENNQNYKSIDGNLYSKDGSTLIQYAIGKTDTTFTIPDSVTSIRAEAFYDCSNLTSIFIPNSVTSIGKSAFFNCDSLTSIFIPNSVTTIGYDAFAWCENLASITIPNGVTSIGECAFWDCTNLTIYCEAISKPSGWDEDWNPDNCPVVWGGYIDIEDEKDMKFEILNDTEMSVVDYAGTASEIIIPKYVESSKNVYMVTSIGRDAFYACKNLTTIAISNSVTSIGESAFDGCENLTSVTIPNSVTSIGDWAFAYCSSLTSITIPNSVTIIGDYAFWDCTNLTSVTIPNSVTTIGHWAFIWCENLTSITIPDSVTSIGEWAFAYCTSLTIYCEAISKPSGWHSNWNPDNRPVIWGSSSNS